MMTASPVAMVRVSGAVSCSSKASRLTGLASASIISLVGLGTGCGEPNDDGEAMVCLLDGWMGW